jgi:hypothetical protein
MQSALWTFFGVFVGLLAARYYYKRASSDLSKEAKELYNLLRMVLTSLENAKLVRLNRDKDGKIIGMIHEGQGIGILPALTGSGEGVTIRPSSLNVAGGNKIPE